MSRIGNRAIVIPSGVTIHVADGEIQVKGPKVTLSGRVPEGISAKVGDGELSFVRGADTKEARRLHGLARALANNMVIGATTGFTRRLEIEGVGYRADVRGKELHLLATRTSPLALRTLVMRMVSVPPGVDCAMGAARTPAAATRAMVRIRFMPLLLRFQLNCA